MTYSEYISLGYNCEAAFQIRRILGHDSSSFFSWNVTTLPQLMALLEHRFEGILLDDHIGPHGGGLLTDEGYGYKFHSPFASADYKADPDYDSKLGRYRDRTAHLVAKFLRDRGPTESTAYFYKAEGQSSGEEVRHAARRVHSLLAGLHGASPFVLVILQHRDFWEDPWDEPGIFNRYLRRLAPFDDATDGHAQSWDAVFREFPHQEPLRFALA